MRLTFLGTGSAIPSERVQSGILLEDIPFLFDCGSGVVHNLNRSSVEVDDVGHVFLTHSHLDHINDLMSLVKADWLLGRKAIRVYGPTGTQEAIESLFDAYEYLRGKTAVGVNEFEPGAEFEILGHSISTLPTEHSVNSTAYRLDDSFVYSGDTEPVEGMAEFASGCDVLIHECSFPDTMDMSNHTHPMELADIVEDCFVNRLYMTHLYPHTRGLEDKMLQAVEQKFDGETEIAEDMQSIDVKG